MSIGTIALGVLWLIEPGAIHRFKKLLKQPTALLLVSFYLIHLITLLYSEDLAYGWHDAKIKFPLVVFPIVMSTKTFSETQIKSVILGFVLSTLVSTLISFGIFWEVLPTKKAIKDVRDISVFISHIRLSLMICLSVCICTYQIMKSARLRIFFVALIAWFIYFLFVLKSATGIAVLVISELTLLTILIYQQKNRQSKWIISLALLSAMSAIIILSFNRANTYNQPKEPTAFLQLETFTDQGGRYYHDTASKQMENGYYIWINICNEELEESWNNRSSIPLDGKTKNGLNLKGVLLRYLTSKGLRKDRSGMANLSKSDINKIEHGQHTANPPQFKFLERVDEILFGWTMIQEGANPSGNSLGQRIRAWDIGHKILKQSSFFGIGAGDVKNEFEQFYETYHPQVKKEFRIRGHNQFMTVLIATGIPGLVIFFLSLVFLMLPKKQSANALTLTLILIALLSFIAEDTLETQAGVMFYGFFTSLFVFSKNQPFKLSNLKFNSNFIWKIGHNCH